MRHYAKLIKPAKGAKKAEYEVWNRETFCGIRAKGPYASIEVLMSRPETFDRRHNCALCLSGMLEAIGEAVRGS